MIEQTYDYEYEYIDKKLDNGTVIKDVQVIPCRHPNGCKRFTVSSLLKAIFLEKSFNIEYPYSVFPSGFSCDSLSASLTYLDDN